MSVANALWAQKGLSFQPEFVKLARDCYHAAPREVDFAGAPDQAVAQINKWVDNETQHKIKNLIKPDAIDPDTRLVLANAIYFKAKWWFAFKEDATLDDKFSLADATQVPVKMMHGHHDIGYLETDAYQALMLPYEELDLSVLVVLPRKIDGLPQLEAQLTGAKPPAWLDSTKFRAREVRVSLPRFTVTGEIRALDAILAQMGMPLAFSPGADFSGMSEQTALKLQRMIHMAYVNVHEKGTKATGATVGDMRRVGITPEPAAFRADHPFLFMIRENGSGSILFLGRLSNPRPVKSDIK